MKTDLNVEFERGLSGEDRRRVIDWVARSSWWPDPEVVRKVGVVYPKTRRTRGEKEPRGYILAEDVAAWKNEPAASACYRALGVAVDGATPRAYTGARVCHIHEGSPVLPAHYTRLANLIVVPKALESFTEWRPVRDVLKWRAWELYQYLGPSQRTPSPPDYYPEAWPGLQRLEPMRLAAVVADLLRRQKTHPYYHVRIPGHSPSAFPR